MGEGTRWLRVRAVVSAWVPVLVAVLAVFALAGGWAAYTAHAAPGTITEQSEQAHWTVTGEFQHSADVTRENPIFDVGTTLSNRSTYFTGASPVLDGRYVATYSGIDAAAATIDLDAALVMRSVGEDTVYWTDRTSLDEASVDDVQAGESTNIAFALNATRIANRQSAIQESLGQTPGDIEAFVVVRTAVNGTADGRPASLSLTHRLPISVDGGAYTVGPAETGSETVTTTETVTVTNEYGLLWTVGGPLLLLGGVSGLAILGVGRRRDAFALSENERDLLAFRDERAEFDEWVVRARLPDSVHDRQRAEAASLADVVDFAIDSDTGVVEDTETGTFYAISEQLLVAYEPPALARSADTDGDTRAGLLDGVYEQLDSIEDETDSETGESEATDGDHEETPRPQD
ncbi:DUF5305 family protein [Halobacterium sp. KA-6]|uniref:DUF5305 family protein n=1 Tax=Halobacterium sp. KA-6 TaxID=2896368 RepID=UPI001E454C67|nr:DUF5305 family protein [Halobacterium sp. KA-6]MCD2203023.1 DUF5305 domain-containing protein [Halobacterium sp. KA-6]